MRNLRTKAGFTLIEILVALSIMVIVLGAAYGTFRAATTSVSRCRARTALEEDGQQILGRMAREIRCSYFPAPDDSQPLSPSSSTSSSSPKTPPGTDAPSGLTRSERPLPQYLNGTGGGGAGHLQLLTTGGIPDPDQLSSGLYNVSYRLDTEKKVLFRRQADLLQSAQSDTDAPRWVCVGRGVESVAYSFSDGKNWTDDWRTGEGGGLPGAVKIDLVLKDPDGNQRAFSTTVFIPMQAAPFTQTLIQPPSPR